MNKVEDDVEGAGKDERKEQAEPCQIRVSLRTVKIFHGIATRANNAG